MLSLLAVPLSTCETRTTRFGHIQSEDGSYSTFTERCWVLDPPDATTVTLSFQRFDTEANYDVVRVYDGGDTSAPQLSPSRGFSGTAIPSQLTSTGGTMTVTFHSDYSITRRPSMAAAVNARPGRRRSRRRSGAESEPLSPAWVVIAAAATSK